MMKRSRLSISRSFRQRLAGVCALVLIIALFAPTILPVSASTVEYVVVTDKGALGPGVVKGNPGYVVIRSDTAGATGNPNDVINGSPGAQNYIHLGRRTGQATAESPVENPLQIPHVLDANTYIEGLTEQTRGEYALKLKVYESIIGNNTDNATADEKQWRPVIVGKTDATQARQVFIAYKRFENFRKDTGRDYQEIVLPLSDFEETGVVRHANIAGYTPGIPDPEFSFTGYDIGMQNSQNHSDYSLVDVDWTKIHPSIGFKKVNCNLNGSSTPRGDLREITYALSTLHNKGNRHQGRMVVADVQIIKLVPITASLRGTMLNGDYVDNGNQTNLEMPANAAITVIMTSDFNSLEEVSSKITMESAQADIPVTVSAHPNINRAYVVTPDTPLVSGEEYTVTIGAGLSNIGYHATYSNAVEQTYGGDSFSFTAGNKIETLNPPTNLTASSVAADSVTLTWNHPSDENGIDLMYDVYRDGAKIAGPISALMYIDDAVAPNTSYSYYVVAIKDIMMTPCAAISVITPELSGPAGLSVTGTGTSTVEIKWNPVLRHNIIGYNIYMGDTLLNTIKPITDTSFTATNLQPNTEYAFNVTFLEQLQGGVSFESAKSEIMVSTDAGAYPSPLKVLYQEGNYGGGIVRLGHTNISDVTDGWLSEVIDSDYALTGPALEAGGRGNGSQTRLFSNGVTEYISLDDIKSDVGIFLYAKPMNNTNDVNFAFRGQPVDTGAAERFRWTPTSAQLTGGEYIPIYIPLSADLTNYNSYNTVGGLIVQTSTSGNAQYTRVRLDNVMIVKRTPEIEKVSFRDAYGNSTAAGLQPVNVSAVSVKFTTPMEESSLAGIKLKKDGVGIPHTGSYNRATLTYSMTPDRKLDYSTEYTVEVPATVRAVDAYGTFGEIISASNRRMTLDTLNHGPSIGAAYSASFTTQDNPLPIVLTIENGAEDTVFAKAVISNNTGASQDVAVIICTYDLNNGVYIMKDYKFKSDWLSAGAADITLFTEPVSKSGMALFKAFVWNDLDEMIPMSDLITFP
ncbi:MAG: fibronectin type III domain-containing protein [Firmicutes bacterium]|nr:fibronectin type III domain-containing protein [Bacillota bacterium]